MITGNTALVMISLFAFATIANAGSTIPVITNNSEIETHIGKTVTIRGIVENSRIASILGVDVESFDPDLRNELAEATGIIERDIITEKTLQKQAEKFGIVASRGPGVYYRLKEVSSDKTAHVKKYEAAGKSRLTEGY